MTNRKRWTSSIIVLGSVLIMTLIGAIVEEGNLFATSTVSGNTAAKVEAATPRQLEPPLLRENIDCAPDGYPNWDLPNLSVNCPDLFAWLKFLEVNAQDPDYPELVYWQMWATDSATFPPNPQPDQCSDPESDDPEHCPTWPSPEVDAIAAESAGASKRNPDLHPPSVAETILASLEEETGVPTDLGAISGETIRRNRASFDYVVDHDLWYQEGLAQRFNKNFKVEFPIDSIELKFNWLPMKYVDDPSRYFTAEVDGELQGLVAMHITTKDLPNWFWATFEHVDNPGRCDFIGCRDSFGLTLADIPPHNELKLAYPPGELTPELVELMEDEGVPSVFQNYRLKGSQITFTDSMGEPTLLGNSVTEYGFVPTASCITCHARAGVDWNGKKPASLRIFGEKLGGQTFNGAPDPELFYDLNNPTRRYIMQVDFVWAIPFRAQPIGGVPPTPTPE